MILNYNGRSALGEILDRAIESALTQDYLNLEAMKLYL